MTPRRGLLRAATIAAIAMLVAGCVRVGAPLAEAASPSVSAPEVAATATPAVSTAASASVPGSAIRIDLAAIREALIGPPPVPEGWEGQVDELMTTIEAALDQVRLPDVAGLPADQAACATWEPLVGKLGWATGALLERQVFIAHLGQLATLASPAIAADVDEALRIASAAAAEQLKPDGDRAIVARAPTQQLRAVGRWALEACALPIAAEAAPNVEGWTEDEIAQSCTWDREWLTEAQEEFREGPGDGRFATHPHELEISLDLFVYPAWHEIRDVDNDASPPTFEVVPIEGGFCDR